MRIAAAVLLLGVALPTLLRADPLGWNPAVFRGIAVGRAHRFDAVRLLGPPDSDRRSRSGEQLLYKGRGDHKGDLTVRLDRSGVIVEIQESFPVAIPRTRIYKELGADARTAHFSQARCATHVANDAAVDALYRDPRGGLELTLYPERGIVLWPDQFGYDFAAILYLARPPGASRPPACIDRR